MLDQATQNLWMAAGSDASYAMSAIQEAAYEWKHSALVQRRPFVLMRPRLFPDGNKWCALYGDNIAEGVAAFGDTPEQASIQFDIEWLNQKSLVTRKETP